MPRAEVRPSRDARRPGITILDVRMLRAVRSDRGRCERGRYGRYAQEVHDHGSSLDASCRARPRARRYGRSGTGPAHHRVPRQQRDLEHRRGRGLLRLARDPQRERGAGERRRLLPDRQRRGADQVATAERQHSCGRLPARLGIQQESHEPRGPAAHQLRHLGRRGVPRPHSARRRHGRARIRPAVSAAAHGHFVRTRQRPGDRALLSHPHPGRGKRRERRLRLCCRGAVQCGPRLLRSPLRPGAHDAHAWSNDPLHARRQRAERVPFRSRPRRRCARSPSSPTSSPRPRSRRRTFSSMPFCSRRV